MRVFVAPLSAWTHSALSGEVMVVGIDRKFAFDDAGRRRALAPGHDEVLFFDLEDPARPSLIGSLPRENSIVGPPINVAVTPDQKLALIANALCSVRADHGVGCKAVTEAGHLLKLASALREGKLFERIAT